MTRRRLTTWSERAAAPAPAVPHEDGGHPASYEDPDADAHLNGDPSTWAEDPDMGPYGNPPPPALPGTEAPQGHPATDPKHYFPKAAGSARTSAEIRRAAEAKAARCLRIAASMLGRTASVAALEDQALDLMHLSDRQIAAALDRIGGSDDDLIAGAAKETEEKADEEKPAKEAAARRAAYHLQRAAYWKRAAGETEEKADEEKPADEKPAKEAAARRAPSRRASRTAEDLMLAEMLAEAEAAPAAKTSEEDALLAEMLAEAEAAPAAAKTSEEDALLAEMLAEAEAAPAVKTSEEDALLAEMLAETEAAPAAAPMASAEGPVACGEEMPEPLMPEDPMGLMEFGEGGVDGDDFSALYASEEKAPEEEKVEEKPAKEASRSGTRQASAAVRPQPRATPSRGVRALGGAPKVASADAETAELSKLWESAPDVSGYFG